MTPQSHVDEMKEFAKKLAESDIEGLEDCYVDDWGRFSNFQLFVKFDIRKQRIVRNICRGIRKFAKLHKNFKIRKIEAPKGMYEPYSNSFIKYESNRIGIDIDYNNFHPETNSFSQTSEAGQIEIPYS